MPPLFYTPLIATTSHLPEDESHHCTRVLRLKEGDPITLTDGNGTLYTACLTTLHPRHCQVTITGQTHLPPPCPIPIHLAIAPPKNPTRTEWLIEKATEIGLTSLTFLHCHHSERTTINLPRLQKIAINALKQSRQTYLPQIRDITRFHTFITEPVTALRLIAHCAPTPKQWIGHAGKPNHPTLILIGPEGDFSTEEITAALTAGYIPVTLSANRLRTETAALIACHAIHLLNPPPPLTPPTNPTAP